MRVMIYAGPSGCRRITCSANSHDHGSRAHFPASSAIRYLRAGPSLHRLRDDARDLRIRNQSDHLNCRTESGHFANHGSRIYKDLAVPTSNPARGSCHAWKHPL